MAGKILSGVFIALVVVLMTAEISHAAGKARVPKTGETADSYGAGSDGVLEKGVAWPVPRFTDNGDGTITDTLTGLLWLKNANCFGARSWAAALSAANTLAGSACGLSDGSVAGGWRLPDVNELESLLDASKINPPLPTGHPFTGVQSSLYWSSTTSANDPSYAWGVYFYDGFVVNFLKVSLGYVWPVRGGQ